MLALKDCLIISWPMGLMVQMLYRPSSVIHILVLIQMMYCCGGDAGAKALLHWRDKQIFQ